MHVQLERLQDMQMTGGREDLYAVYEVGVNAEGACCAAAMLASLFNQACFFGALLLCLFVRHRCCIRPVCFIAGLIQGMKVCR